ncbi:hypothetical protein AURDEDRAFT_178000 [Auricularia subglabra TFB-10046 SS5]|uniref:Uncharacterized protein n=1 Tax=Auricularia subglabra (strain TFB-10046 / SS5) TaxID=717982 RepID=J0WM80_AURST|nr:hypothetical protein AURDEDRAFT_178000 [Auricularia subglabra TFB-10046 SS5]
MGALEACPNLLSLDLVLVDFDNFAGPRVLEYSEYQDLLDDLARVPRLHISGITRSLESFVLELFDHAGVGDLTLDYRGRRRSRGRTWYLSLPCPCRPLRDPLKVSLSVRGGIYELVAVDSTPLRRTIVLDERSIARAPLLWDGYLRNKALLSATVDALAWTYFNDGVPSDCALSILTITVRQDFEELDHVSLADFQGLQELCVEKLDRSTQCVPEAIVRLVGSRPVFCRPLARLVHPKVGGSHGEQVLRGLAEVVEESDA